MTLVTKAEFEGEPDEDAMHEQMTTAMNDLEDYFASMALNAPGPVKNDMAVLADATSEYAAALDKATIMDEMDEATSVMEKPEVEGASERVTEFIEDECGVDFDTAFAGEDLSMDEAS